MTQRVKCELCGRTLPYREFIMYKWQESYCSKECCEFDKMLPKDECCEMPDKETLIIMSIEFNTDDSIYKEEFIEEEDELLDF